MKKLVYGVGTNDAPYRVSRNACRDGVAWVCPKYSLWKAMLQRGYSLKFKEKNPTYRDASVCDAWHTFSTFCEWLDRQQWEGLQLDKDLLSPGNAEYSPSTSVFVPRYLNVLFTDARAVRGTYPIGVCWNKKGNYFQMKCGNGDGTRTIVDCFPSPAAAHIAWQKKKAEVISALLKRYEGESFCDQRVVSVLRGKINTLLACAESGSITVRL